MKDNTPNETLKDVGEGINPLATIEMPPYSGDIGIEELSPTLQRVILEGQGSGGGNVQLGRLVIKDIVTKKVTATTQDQTSFTIPFDDFETAQCHLDIRINSTWINPERYTVSGTTVALQDGVDKGKDVFFSCYYLTKNIVDDVFVTDITGDKTKLQTVDKTNLVNAINELKRTGGGGSGNSINVFQRTGGTWGEFTATSATNTFTVSGFNGTEKCISVHYRGLPLVPNKQFNISSSGVVTLSFKLAVGEVIDYCVSDVSFDYEDLANKPNLALKADARDTSLSGNIVSSLNGNAKFRLTGSEDKVFIQAGDSSSDSGSINISGYMGKNLNEFNVKITDLRNAKVNGYPISTEQPVRGINDFGNDFNNVLKKGYWYCSAYANSPLGDTTGQWYLEVLPLDDSGQNVIQIARRRTSDYGTMTFTRQAYTGVWTAWLCMDSSIPFKIFANAEDLNTITAIGRYSSASTSVTTSLLNKPINSSGYVDLNIYSARAGSLSWLVQEFTLRTTSSEPLKFERISYDSGTTWKNWYQFANTSKINTLSLLNGWTYAFATSYTPTATNNGYSVTISGGMASGTLTKGTTLFTLPSECRPTSNRIVYIPKTDSTYHQLVVLTNGNVNIDSNTWTAGSYIVQINYVI